MKIRIIDYGVASRIGDIIYVHKKLKKKYPLLYKNILKHERMHTSGFDLRDLIIDFQGKQIEPKKEFYKFILTTPSSWIQFLPIGIYDKEIKYDISMMFIWFWILLLILLLCIVKR